MTGCVIGGESLGRERKGWGHGRWKEDGRNLREWYEWGRTSGK